MVSNLGNGLNDRNEIKRILCFEKKNVIRREGISRIVESWDWHASEEKATKARYWRNAPIAETLKPVIDQLMDTNPDSSIVLPRVHEWEQAYQASILRSFCKKIEISSVRFHTLRACFATHLLASGVNEATVMRIGGWKDFKAFQTYVRLAGLREKGATEGLGEIFFAHDSIKRADEISRYDEK